MARKTSAVSGGDTGLTTQYNFLRDETQGSARLLAQGTNALRVFVNGGLVYFGGDVVEFTGSESALMSDTAASSRIDAISLQSSNVLLVTTGIEDDTPTAPDIPDDDIPICTVYIRNGGTKIDDTDGSGGDGYIDKDLRPFIKKGEVENYSDVSGSRALNTDYQNTSKVWLMVITGAHCTRGTIGHGRAIFVIGVSASPSTEVGRIEVEGGTAGVHTVKGTITVLVPPNWYYKLNSSTSGAGSTVTIITWWEADLQF